MLLTSIVDVIHALEIARIVGKIVQLVIGPQNCDAVSDAMSGSISGSLKPSFSRRVVEHCVNASNSISRINRHLIDRN